MGRIVEKIKVGGKAGEESYDALIDTGADRTLISKRVAEKIKPVVYGDLKQLYSFDGRKVDSRDAIISVSIKNCAELTAKCRIVEYLEGEQVVIGHDFLQNNKAYIDMEGDKLILNCPRHWRI